MKTYKVIFTKYETYEVEAKDMDEAENKAFVLLDNDPWAWMDPVDKIEVKEEDK